MKIFFPYLFLVDQNRAQGSAMFIGPNEFLLLDSNHRYFAQLWLNHYAITTPGLLESHRGKIPLKIYWPLQPSWMNTICMGKNKQDRTHAGKVTNFEKVSDFKLSTFKSTYPYIR